MQTRLTRGGQSAFLAWLFTAFLLGTAAARDVQNVPGTSVSMEPLPGFAPARAEPGFVDQDRGGHIDVREYAGPSLADKMTKDLATVDKANAALAAKKIRIDAVEKLQTGAGMPLLLAHGAQEIDGVGYDVWIGIYLDMSSVIVNFAIPKSSAPGAEAIKAMFLSVKTGRALGEDEFFANLPFTIDIRAPIRMTSAGTGIVAMTIGDEPQASQTYPWLIAEFADAAQAGDPMAAAEAKLKALDRVRATPKLAGRPAPFAGVEGLLIDGSLSAPSSVSDYFPPKRVLQYSAIKGGKSLRLLILVPEAKFDADRPAIEALVSSIKFKE